MSSRPSGLNEGQAKAPLACYYCRRKKIKCSGATPCQQCSKRGLGAECRIPNYHQLHQASSHSDTQGETPISVVQLGPTSQQSPVQQQSLPDLSFPYIQQQIQQPSLQCYRDTQQIPPVTQSTANPAEPGFDPEAGDGISPSSNTSIPAHLSLSSSYTFGSKVQQLLGQTQTESPRSINTPPNQTSHFYQSPHLGHDELPTIPSEHEARRLLEAYLFFIGQTQYHFDGREISDRISFIYKQATDHISPAHLSTPGSLEVMLTVAVGKLFLGELGGESLPGYGLFTFAQRNMPHLGELCNLGRLGVELLALVAVYLQNSDREKEAYIYIGTALRLAISHGLHRQSDVEHYTHSERVHLNRLWWTVYMQERRLAAATSSPPGINDELIELDTPMDSPGFSPAAPLCINIKIARVTGRIMNVIYGKNAQPEQTLVSSIRETLQNISGISRELPSELDPDRYDSTSEVSFRTIASLHFMLCQATLLTIRPLMLHVAELILSGKGPSREDLNASSMGKLCRTCCEAARRLLRVIVMLRERNMLVIFGFTDFDATFSAAFILILSAVFEMPYQSETTANPEAGIQDAIQTMRFLVERGHSTAMQRLREIERLWALMKNLLRNLDPKRLQSPKTSFGPDTAMWNTQSGSNPDQVALAGNQQTGMNMDLSLLDDNLWDITASLSHPAQNNEILAQAELAEGGENYHNSYWSVYNNPDWGLTGEDIVDFAEFERHLEGLWE